MPDLHDDQALLATLASNPGFLVAKRIFTEKREEYFLNLAKSLWTPGAVVDQRVIDEKRGFWLGLRYGIKAVEDAQRAFNKQTKE